MLESIIDPGSVSLEQAVIANDIFHALYRQAIIESRTGVFTGDWKAAFEALYDMLNTLDTESRYLVEDILDEMGEDDEGGII